LPRRRRFGVFATPISARRFQGFYRSGAPLQPGKIVRQRKNEQASTPQITLPVRDALDIAMAAIADPSATLAAAGRN